MAEPPHDPLARFARAAGAPAVTRPAAPEPPPVQADAEEDPSYQPVLQEIPALAENGELQPYTAYHAVDMARFIDIVRAVQPARCPTYRYFIDLSHGPHFYTGFTLFFTYMTVRVRGTNLKPVVDAFRHRRCNMLCEWHPEIYQEPAPGEPKITKLEIVIKPLDQAQLDAELPEPNQTGRN